MNSNFPPTPNSNVIKRPLTFESAEGSLYGLALFIQGLVLRSVLKASSLGYKGFVPAVVLDNGDGCILAAHKAVKVFRGIARIRHAEKCFWGRRSSMGSGNK